MAAYMGTDCLDNFQYISGMSEESIDKKKIRQFRLAAVIALAVVACGFWAAFTMESDIIAGLSCLVLGVALAVLGKDKNDARLHIGTGISIGVGLFFLWLFVRYLILA